ncbi:MAG: hypothetical protein AMS22_16535 [Thiotrichales bacterium SG8_50]|jgi:hypothetical protein|nr:MAG: hypothetical protein AMS22_16535 [Thiotrichales bacterium SG8_50]
MGSTKIVGFVLLAVGVVLLYFGYNASQSVGSQFKSAFAGSMSDKAMMYYVGGAVLAGIGAFLAFIRK